MKSVAPALLGAAAAVLLLAGAAPALDHASLDFEGAGISSARGGLPFEPTLPEIQANVFTPSCALSFCHGEGMSAQLDLRDGNSFSNLVGVPSVEVPTLERVTPFDPDASYLICKLEACPEMSGQQMPVFPGPLDQTVIDVIRTWILLGAPEFPPVGTDEVSWGRVKTLYR